MEDPDQNSELADARALILWVPWVPLSLSFQALVSLSVCQSGERGDLEVHPVMWVSGRRARGQWRLGKGGAPPAQPPRDSPAAESGRDSYYWLQMTFASMYLLHFYFAFNFRAIHGVCAAWGM